MNSAYIVEAYLGETSIPFNLKEQINGAASKPAKPS